MKIVKNRTQCYLHRIISTVLFAYLCASSFMVALAGSDNDESGTAGPLEESAAQRPLVANVALSEVRTMPLPSQVNRVALSDDGCHVAVTAYEDARVVVGTQVVVNLDTQQASQPNTWQQHPFAMDQRGRQLSLNGPFLKRSDVEQDIQLPGYPYHDTACTSRDGRFVYVLGASQQTGPTDQILIIDMQQPDHPVKVVPVNGQPRNLSVAGDCLLMSLCAPQIGCYPGPEQPVVNILNLSARETIATEVQLDRHPLSVALHPNGQALYVADETGIQVADLHNPLLVQPFLARNNNATQQSEPNDAMRAICLNNRGSRLFVLRDTGIDVVNAHNAQPVSSLSFDNFNPRSHTSLDPYRLYDHLFLLGDDNQQNTILQMVDLSHATLGPRFVLSPSGELVTGFWVRFNSEHDTVRVFWKVEDRTELPPMGGFAGLAVLYASLRNGSTTETYSVPQVLRFMDFPF